MTRSKADDRTVPEESGVLRWTSFILADAAVAAWLGFALLRFTGKAGAVMPGILAPVILVPLLAWAFGLHVFRPARPLQLIGRILLFGACLGALGALGAGLRWIPLHDGEALWLAAAAACLVGLQRAVHFGRGPHPSDPPGETLRWIAVGIAGTLIMLPFYYPGGIGSGDAHWYAVMLADFLAQLRAGVFPVWVGQSVNAFNGAISPLRFAPGFQYFGALVDLLTARALDPMAVRNASVALAGLLGAYSCYACLRAVTPRRPWMACCLTLLWVCGPGFWAPAVVGDQYMTAVAMPFVPVVLYGCWRVWDRNDGWARFWITTGLAALWLCHSPVALWMTLIAAGIYIPALITRRSWRSELGIVAMMAVGFMVLGSVPFVSVLTLNDTARIAASGDYTAHVVRAYFPGNFLPIDPKGDTLKEYQLGYALLGALVGSLLLLCWRRPRAAWVFAIASLALVPFFVPVPGLTHALWTHVPGWFVTVQNVWPMQRLVPIWSTLIVFLSAIMLGSDAGAPAGWKRAAWGAAFLGALSWSVHEARKIIPRVSRTTVAETVMAYSPENLVLTRYAYSSFEYAPSYFSHSYMDPWFENRLLDRHTLEPVVANADAAAPLNPSQAGSRLVRSGVLTADEIPGSTFYKLSPSVVLDPGKRYALRLDFTQPDRSGTLQLLHPSLFREYGLPDSGLGINRADDTVPSRAFGSQATNSHVVPMSVSGPGPYSIFGLFIANEQGAKSYRFANYELYSYDRSHLPIDVESWIPYRANVKAEETVYLETPRMWLNGWEATVNGQPAPTLRSPDNLVMVALAAGENQVVLRYHAPVLLTSAFWISATGWGALGMLGLCQLALFCGGQALGRFPSGTSRALSAACGIILGALAISAVWVVVSRRTAHRMVSLGGAGPLRIEFTRPYRQSGRTQPLLSTGHAGAGTIVLITFIDARHVRLGADVWGSLFKSEPVEMDYNEIQSLVVSDSALYPADDSRVKALSPRELGLLKGELRLELNGRTILRVPCNAYATLSSEILLGEARFGSVADRTFAGEIVRAERLPIPRTLTLPSGSHAHLRVRFPEDSIGATEPLLSATAGSDSVLWTATPLPNKRLKIGFAANGGGVQQAELGYDPSREHDLDIELRGPLDGISGSACAFDAVPVLRADASFPGLPPVLVSGLTADAPGLQVRFTGPQLDLSAVPDRPRATAAHSDGGAEHLIVRFPRDKSGRSEPLLVTGRAGEGDFVYVVYEDATHIRIGYDHWNVGGTRSAPIEVDLGVAHELWIRMSSLYPPLDDTGHWNGTAPAQRAQLTSTISVVLDGKTVYSAAGSAYPATASEITVARNPIGGSTCDPEFSGTLEFSERGDEAEPAALGK